MTLSKLCPTDDCPAGSLQTQRAHDAVPDRDDDDDGKDRRRDPVVEEIFRLEVSLSNVVFDVDRLQIWAVRRSNSQGPIFRGRQSLARSNVQARNGKTHPCAADQGCRKDQQARVRHLHGRANVSRDRHDENGCDTVREERTQSKFVVPA